MVTLFIFDIEKLSKNLFLRMGLEYKCGVHKLLDTFLSEVAFS